MSGGKTITYTENSEVQLLGDLKTTEASLNPFVLADGDELLKIIGIFLKTTKSEDSQFYQRLSRQTDTKKALAMFGKCFKKRSSSWARTKDLLINSQPL